MDNSPKVIIIGAGASGIAAAVRLLEKGFSDIQILEAEDRIGGRIHTVPFGKSVVDLGAQWCHGEKDNIVYDLVKDLNVLNKSYNTYQDNTFYDSSGKLIDKNLSDQLFRIAFDIFEGEEEVVTEEVKSFGDYFVNIYNKKIEENFGSNKDVQELAKIFLNWFHKFYLCLDAPQTWYDVALSNNVHYEHCDGDPLLNWGDKGFKQFLDILMKKHSLPSEYEHLQSKILLNKKVNKIFWDETKNGLVKVTCEDTSTFTAKHVVITVPLGVLKEKHKTLFSPQLPLYKQNSIEGLSMGVVGKIFLKFNDKWWPDETKGFSFVWSENDRKKIQSEFPFGPIEEDGSWLENIFGFYVIDKNPSVLMGWLVGKYVKQVEILPKDVISGGCIYLLNKFLGDKYNIPPPAEILWSSWYKNENFRGTYSFRSVETEKRNTCASELSEPLISHNGIPSLLFGGEATHLCYYSTVHGAVESGYREADRIANIYKKVEKCKVVIVGAGLAGLGAAKTLVEEGCQNIIILEAHDEPGGRIHSVEVDGGIIELGAQWLHGKENDLYDIASKFGLLSNETSEEGLGIYVRDDGFIYDEALVNRVAFEVGKILEKCEHFVDSITYPASLGEYLEEQFAYYIKNSDDTDEIKRLKWELFDWHVRFQIIDNSCHDLKQLSAKYWGKYVYSQGEQNYINFKHGYKSLVDVLVECLPRNVLKLKTPVKEIYYGPNKLVVECQNFKIETDHVIYTPSIGVLQNSLNKFHPPLPNSIINNISKMGFYGIAKIFLIFEYKWWSFDGLQLIWKRGANVNKELQWTKHITGFDNVLNQPNVLLGWVGGDGVKTMENLPENKIAEHCVTLLKKFLNNEIPPPIKVLKSKWTSCKWIQGGYGHVTPELDSINTLTLLEPVCCNNIPRIYFAGEALHPTHFSTTHGAFECGKIQAKKLLCFIKKTCSKL